MKKIAILTQPLHTNYGGNLQNFALQTALKKLGHQPITLDRHSTIKLRTRLKLGYFKRWVLFFLKGAPKPKFSDYFSTAKQEYADVEIRRFISIYIDKTPRLYSNLAVEQAFNSDNFDAIIVGSDQCWRPMYSPNISTYFLDFLHTNNTVKKIAYAASFGTEEWEYTPAQTDQAKKLIQQFDAVTVREKQAVNLVKEKLNKEAKFVLDPTLLLDKADYLKVINACQPPLPTHKGVYTYVLDTDAWKAQVIKQVCDNLGISSFKNQPKASVNNPSNNAEDYLIPSIEGWIKGFVDAEFVITDSFHGTVFSILFNKPFISLLNIDRGASRFHSLLSEFGLEDRLLTNYDSREITQIQLQEIDWFKINKKVCVLREESLDFLNNSLS